ncbi:MAG: glycosyltransferase [Rhodospirillaceae bacterium]
MTRVMHIINADRLAGGMEIFLSRLAPGLKDAGLEQLVVTRRHPELANFLEAAGIRTARLSLHKRDPLSWLAVRWLAWRFKPDFIVSWLPHAARRVPNGPWLRVAQIGLYNSLRFYKRVDAMVVPAPDMAEHFAGLGFPAEHIHILPHFTDHVALPPIDRASVDTPANVPVLLACGRLYHLKAFEVAVEVAARLPDTWLWLVGEGEEEPKLRALVARLGITDRARFLGWRRDIPAVMAAADVMLMTSRREPFGLVFLEAWHAGLPVVATASEGARYLIRPGETGMLGPIDDVETLTRLTATVLTDPVTRARIIAGGRERLTTEFSREATVAAYLRFFEQARRPRPTP